MPSRTRPPRAADLRRLPARRLLVAWTTVLFLASGRAQGDDTYPVSGFTLRYAAASPALPDLGGLAGIEVALGHDGEAYMALQPGQEGIRFGLGRVPEAPAPVFRPSALRSVGQQLVAVLKAQGFGGLRVSPDPRDIDPASGADLRGSFTRLRLVLSVARVAEVETHAEPGSASPSELARIRDRSPLKPGSPLREDELRAYLARLSRESGRQVEAQLLPSHEPDAVELHYRVVSQRPSSAWLQVSNTGTEGTTRGRQRLGMARRGLAAEDDLLRLDYVTGGFDSVHAAVGSYHARLAGTERWGWRVDGSWSRFDSSQLGLDDAFSGKQWDAGAQLDWNLLQREELFVDALLGLRYQEIETRDRLSSLAGDAQLALPGIGVRIEHTSPRLPGRFRAGLERGLPASGTDAEQLARLGRADVDERFHVLRFDGDLSFFPAAWRSGGTEGTSPLAHELALSVDGQYAFGSRLIPVHQQTLGGLYSVRGYPQSIVAGDSVLRGSAEYRLHVARLLGSTGSLPGVPGADVLLRAFVDAGRALQSDRSPFESHQTLLGAGLGLELRYRALRLRLDWGRALEPIPLSGVDSGDSAYHAVATLLY